MALSDSEEDTAPRKRQKRFIFRGLAEQLEQVQVAGYAAQPAAVPTPVHAASSVTQDEVNRWRELNCAADFTDLAVALNPFIQSLPLVLHHQGEIVDLVLDRIHVRAVLSLEAVMHVAAAVVRDLQQDFLQYLPRFLSTLTKLMSAGGGRMPEVLQHVFPSLTAIIRTLAKHLAGSVPALLQCSRGLRLHAQDHIRSLAAHAFAFPLRHASEKKLDRAMDAIFAEHAKHPSEGRAQACGRLLAQAVQAANHSLHSRAPLILCSALRRLAPADQGTEGTSPLPVLEALLAELLDHMRKGTGRVAYDAVIALAEEQLHTFKSCGDTVASSAAAQSAADALGLAAQTIEYYNGSRVEDYAPFFALTAEACFLPDQTTPGVLKHIAGGQPAVMSSASQHFVRQALRLLQSLVRSHARGKLGPLADAAPHCATLLASAQLDDVIPFVQQALDPWGHGVQPGVVRALGEALCGALVKGVEVEEQQGPSLAALAHMLQVAQAENVAWLKGNATLAGVGPAVAALAKLPLPDDAGSLPTAHSPSTAWAALQCLPFACPHDQAESAVDAFISSAEANIASTHPAIQHQDALFLACSAARLKLDRLIKEQVALAAEALAVSGLELPHDTKQALTEALMPNLAAPAQPLRLASLRLLMLLYDNGPGHEAPDSNSGAEGQIRDVLGQWVTIEGQACTLENGRRAAASIMRLQAALEHGQVPAAVVGPLVRCLLGALHIRFAVLWPPCIGALAMALDCHPDATWSLISPCLRDTQAALLLGDSQAHETAPSGRPQAMPRSAEEWYEAKLAAGSIAASGGCTDSAVRLSSLLKVLAGTSAGRLEKVSHDWVPLFLNCARARQDSSASDGDGEGEDHHADSAVSRIGAKVWREQMRAWLAFLSGIRGPQRLAQSPVVLRTVAGLLSDADSAVQQGALACLKAYKLPALDGNHEQLAALTKEAGMRDALLAFPFSPSADASPSDQLRPGLMGVALRVLWPHMRRRSTKGKGHSSPRAAIFSALAALPPPELATLLLLHLRPLGHTLHLPATHQQDTGADQRVNEHVTRLFVEPWWVAAPSLQADGPAQAQGRDTADGGKELRSSCLRLLAQMWTRFPEDLDWGPLWHPFFAAALPLLPRMEMGAEAVPALLEVLMPLAASPKLAAVLDPDFDCSRPDSERVDAISGEARLAGAGHRLLGAVIVGLGGAHCSPAAVDAALTVIEGLLEHGNPLAERLLQPHAVTLAASLRMLTLASSPATAARSKRTQGGKHKARVPSGRATALRALSILERMGAGLLLQGEAASALTDALLPLLSQAHGPKSKRLDEGMIMRILAALTASWKSLPADAPGVAGPSSSRAEKAQEAAAAIAPLLGNLSERGSRAAACEAFQSLADMDPQLRTTADLLSSLEAWSTSQLEEMDYDARLGAYRQLASPLWQSLPSCGATALLLRSLRDLRNGSDLAIRHAASQALQAFISALPMSGASMQEGDGAGSDTGPALIDPASGLARLALRVVYPAVKAQLAAPNLAVRQEHLLLLRALAQAAPGNFSQLQSLLDANTEADFFHNITHLQLHRRSRALTRLSKILAAGKLGPSVILGIVAPLLQQALLGASLEEGTPHKRTRTADTDKARGRDAALADSAVDALRTAAAALQWQHYRQLLGRFLRLLSRAKPGSDGASVRAGVSNMLRSRLQRVRDDARSVLLSMAAELGPDYLAYVLDVLQSALPSRGYTAHVLGFTAHSVLAAMAKAHSDREGLLDECTPRVLAILEEQVFGLVGEEKGVSAVVGALREGKRVRSYDTFQLLAQHTTTRSELAPLLGLVERHLPEADSSAVRTKLETLLSAAAMGLSANPSATPKDILVFVHSVLTSAASAAEEAQLQSAGNQQHPKQEDLQQQHDQGNRWLLSVFALTLLHRGLRKGQLGERSPANLTMLDGIVDPLAAALSSRHAPVVSLALRCMGLLLTMPLPGLENVANQAGAAAIHLLRRASNPGDMLAQEAFKLLAAFLRSCPDYQPTNSQLSFLIRWGFTDLQQASSHLGTFALLRAMLQRRIVVPEVYDVVTGLQELMIKCQAGPTRDLCSTVLLQFLLDYPLGSKRLEQHFRFLLTNLSFEYASGRQVAASTLRALSNKLPVEPLLDPWAPIFFLPLVAQLVKETDAACRKELCAAVQTLFQRSSPGVADKLAAWCIKWLGGSEGDALHRAAAQALGLQAQAEGPRFARRVPKLLPATLSALRGAGSPQADGLDRPDADSDAGYWHGKYSVLVLLEKLATYSPSSVRWQEGQVAQQVWEAVASLLVHPHQWVRGAVARLLGLAFDQAAIWEGLLGGGPHSVAPGVLAAQLLQAFTAPEADEGLRKQAVRCLVFLAPRLHCNHAAAGQDVHSAAAGNGSIEAELATLDAAASDSEDEDSAEEAAAQPGDGAVSVTLHGLARRVARLASMRLASQGPVRATALQCMAALGSTLSPEALASCLPLLLPPLYRIDEAGPTEPAEVRELAAEVLQHLKDRAGADEVAAAYRSAQSSVQQARSERKRLQAVQAIADPEAAAQARMRKQQRRAGARKRQAAQHARLRSASSYAPSTKRRRGSTRAAGA
ncbi:hypothetical protein WJX73_001754 [Symbiochloris irregularis]|uniref:Uncharacterized protein n=1 Tax=Symbiochloris irregularis TaxID=706552 RepID=A0AAW1PIU6_9CHLO